MSLVIAVYEMRCSIVFLPLRLTGNGPGPRVSTYAVSFETGWLPEIHGREASSFLINVPKLKRRENYILQSKIF